MRDGDGSSADCEFYGWDINKEKSNAELKEERELSIDVLEAVLSET